MIKQHISELKDFVTILNFSFTHSGGAYPDTDFKFSLDRLMDYDYYEVRGYASVDLKCNNLNLRDFESHLKKIIRNIDDAVTSEIHTLENVKSEIKWLKEELYSFDGYFKGQKQYSEPIKTSGKNRDNSLEEHYVVEDKIVFLYQNELFDEIKLLGENYSKFKFNNIKIDYTITATEEQYINCLHYLLESLISSLENKKYMYTSTPQTPIISNTEKIKWNKSTTTLGYLLFLLDRDGYLELPRKNDDLEIQKMDTAKWINQSFIFDKGQMSLDSLRKRILSHDYEDDEDDEVFKDSKFHSETQKTKQQEDRTYLKEIFLKLERFIGKVEAVLNNH
jgi:hypothetical protein